VAALAWRYSAIRHVRVLPTPEDPDEWVGVEAGMRPAPAMDAG
jgi:hypothetical protein